MSKVSCCIPIQGSDHEPLVNWHDRMSTGQSTSMGNTGRNGILLVDDDASVRGLAATILKHHGYNVIEADSGITGVNCFAEHHSIIGLVVSDIMMPHMTGPEMVDKILALDSSVAVMFMTGCAIGSDLPESVAVLAKPFTPGALLQAVRICLNTSGLQ